MSKLLYTCYLFYELLTNNNFLFNQLSFVFFLNLKYVKKLYNNKKVKNNRVYIFKTKKDNFLKNVSHKAKKKFSELFFDVF